MGPLIIQGFAAVGQSILSGLMGDMGGGKQGKQFKATAAQYVPGNDMRPARSSETGKFGSDKTLMDILGADNPRDELIKAITDQDGLLGDLLSKQGSPDVTSLSD